MIEVKCNLCGNIMASADNIDALNELLIQQEQNYNEIINQLFDQKNPFYDENAKYIPFINFEDYICVSCKNKIYELIKENISTMNFIHIIGPKIINTDTIAIAEFVEDTPNDVNTDEEIFNEQSFEDVESETE